MGNYRIAHDQVVSAVRELRNQITSTAQHNAKAQVREGGEDREGEREAGEDGVKGVANAGGAKAGKDHGQAVLSELLRLLTVLHSYVLVKTLVRVGDHAGAARLLVRVCRHLSRFPQHVAAILTSCVVECQRAGHRQSAYEHAAITAWSPWPTLTWSACHTPVMV